MARWTINDMILLTKLLYICNGKFKSYGIKFSFVCVEFGGSILKDRRFMLSWYTVNFTFSSYENTLHNLKTRFYK